MTRRPKDEADARRDEYYSAVFNSQYYKSGEWFTAAQVSANCSYYGLSAESLGQYLKQLHETGHIERSRRDGGLTRIYRKPKKCAAYLRLRTCSNEDLGIPDATQHWH